MVGDMRREMVGALVARRIPEKAFAEQWESAELAEDLRRVLNLDLPIVEWAREEGIDEVAIRERVDQASDRHMAAKAANMGPDLMRHVERTLLLQLFDQVWKEHLLALDHLRQGIGLRAYGQRDPLNEYKSEAFALFNAMLDELKERVTTLLGRVELGAEPPPLPPLPQMVENNAGAVPAYAGGDAYEPVGETLTLAPPRSDVDPNDPTTWSPQRTQRALPVRIRKEIQALPRTDDVVRSDTGTDWACVCLAVQAAKKMRRHGKAGLRAGRGAMSGLAGRGLGWLGRLGTFGVSAASMWSSGRNRRCISGEASSREAISGSVSRKCRSWEP